MTRAGSTSGPRVAIAVLERSRYRNTPAPRLFRPVTSPQPSTSSLNCPTLADHRIPLPSTAPPTGAVEPGATPRRHPGPQPAPTGATAVRRLCHGPSRKIEAREGRVAAQLSEPGASRTWNWLAKTVARTNLVAPHVLETRR
jgi:hypothetical protein